MFKIFEKSFCPIPCREKLFSISCKIISAKLTTSNFFFKEALKKHSFIKVIKNTHSSSSSDYFINNFLKRRMCDVKNVVEMVSSGCLMYAMRRLRLYITRNRKRSKSV